MICQTGVLFSGSPRMLSRMKKTISCLTHNFRSMLQRNCDFSGQIPDYDVLKLASITYQLHLASSRASSELKPHERGTYWDVKHHI